LDDKDRCRSYTTATTRSSGAPSGTLEDTIKGSFVMAHACELNGTKVQHQTLSLCERDACLTVDEQNHPVACQKRSGERTDVRKVTTESADYQTLIGQKFHNIPCTFFDASTAKSCKTSATIDNNNKATAPPVTTMDVKRVDALRHVERLKAPTLVGALKAVGTKQASPNNCSSNPDDATNPTLSSKPVAINAPVMCPTVTVKPIVTAQPCACKT